MNRILALMVLTLLSWHGKAQSMDGYKRELYALMKTLQENHLSPRVVNDELSREVFHDLFLNLDPDQIYLCREDLQPLLKYEDLIDEQIKANSVTFLQELLPIYKASLDRSRSLVEALLAKPFDLNKDELFTVDSETMRTNDLTAYKERYRKWLKYQVLDRLYTLETTRDGSYTAADEAAARSKVKTIVTKSIDRILNYKGGLDKYVANQYFKAIAGVYDAHTVYMSGDDVQNFQDALSTENFSFGVTLEENGRGDVSIVHLVPGGPAWNSGELHINDVIVKIRNEQDSKATDVEGLGLEMVGDLLDDASSAELTVRRQNGLEVTVALRKEKLHTEENVVKSFILRGEKTIGYIILPGFYTNWEDTEGSRCANDVAREIIKLKKEDINGLIMDVRFNGGGSLQEAIAMAGIFIDEGTLGIFKNKEGQLLSIKDPNRGAIYDGPMALLVNGQSASASELVAAALQDYNRAIIVGSKTFGKATGQQILPLAPSAMGGKGVSASTNNYGFLKITDMKLYRVTGKTAQGTGVMPDIHIPDYFEQLNYRESTMAHHFESDSVFKKTYYRPQPALALSDVALKSKMRVDTGRQFQSIIQFGELLSTRLNVKNKSVPLRWSTYYSNAHSIVDQFTALEKNSEDHQAVYEAKTPKSDEERMKIDSDFEEFTNDWLKKLGKDTYVDEAFRILCDYINSNVK